MTDLYLKSHPPDRTTDGLLLDAMQLAFALDAVTPGELPDSITEGLRRGYLAFADLLIRRDSLILRKEHGMIIDWTLDLIAARLRFLRTLQCRNLAN